MIGLLPFLGIAVWVIVLIKHLDHYAQWMAMIFLCVAPMHLMYVEKPMPDLITELGFFYIILCHVCRKIQVAGHQISVATVLWRVSYSPFCPKRQFDILSLFSPDRHLRLRKRQSASFGYLRLPVYFHLVYCIFWDLTGFLETLDQGKINFCWSVSISMRL
ncbi:MAG: hypothetical protein IPJ13_04885 [Saprospiraceae bacterium]|nr:hypothetical protein [Saprospiraceae bacterium]